MHAIETAIQGDEDLAGGVTRQGHSYHLVTPRSMSVGFILATSLTQCSWKWTHY